MSAPVFGLDEIWIAMGIQLVVFAAGAACRVWQWNGHVAKFVFIATCVALIYQVSFLVPSW